MIHHISAYSNCMKIRCGGPTSYGLAEDVHAVPLEVGAHEGVALRARLVEDGDLPRLHDHCEPHEAVAGGCIAEVNSASEISILVKPLYLNNMNLL